MSQTSLRVGPLPPARGASPAYAAAYDPGGRARGAGRRARPARGLGISPLIALVLLAALVIGVGHGATFVRTQDELNAVAPPEHRGEVSAGFVCCIYALVGGAVVGVGPLGEALPLTASVQVVGALLAVGSLAAGAWQWEKGWAQRDSNP